MLFQDKTTSQKRSDFRAALRTGKLLKFPGSFSPLVSLAIQDAGFDGVYVSGAVLSADLGLPDIGLTTLPEVANRARAIARVTSLPAIVDIDTGFGEPMNVARTIQEIEELGLCGCHIEDQINPKRCGHLDNKNLEEVGTVVKKIRAATAAKHDPNFLLIARTDARAPEGLDAAIARAKAYVDAGAEMIFPEALADEKEFEIFRKQVSVPLLANMTEFGKSRLLTANQLESLGFNVVIYPVTMLRLAMKAAIDGLATIKNEGTQESLLPQMQTRADLYKLIRYEDYNTFDSSVFNFKLEQ